ncbi:MAG: AsmA family protein [Verrucomicrobiota bacterium]
MNDANPPTEGSGDELLPQAVRKKNSLFGFFVKSLAGLLVFVLLLAGFFIVRPTTFDLSRYAEEVDRQITAALGRDVAIEGDILFVTGLIPAVRVEKVRVENPVGWESSQSFAYLEHFETSVNLLELFNREINIDDVRIAGLTLSLERNAAGNGNWEGFAEIKGDQAKGAAHASGAKQNDKLEGLDLDFMELGGITIEDIKVSYRDAEQSEQSVFELDHLTGSAKLGLPVEFIIDGTFLNLPFNGKVKGGTLTSLRARIQAWPIELAGKLGDSSFHLDGQFAAKGFNPPGLLRVELDIPKLSQLVPITGELPDFGSIHLSGEARRTSKYNYSVPEVIGSIGKGKVSASIKLDLSGDVPRIEGELKSSAINLKLFKRKDEGEKIGEEEEGVDGQQAEAELRKNLKKIPKDLLPLVGHLRLQVGEVRGISKKVAVKNIDLELSVEKGKALAEVKVEFAGTPLRGRLALKRERTDGDISFDLDLKSERAEISNLIAYYAKSDRFRGSFEKMRYKVEGLGRTLVDAWFERRVAVEVDGAKMTYFGDNSEWNFFVSKGTMVRKGSELGKMQLTGGVGDAPFKIALAYESEFLGKGARTYFHRLEGKVADLEFHLENQKGEKSETGDAKFVFSVKGERLDKLDSVYEMDLPPMGPYSAEGVFIKTGAVLKFQQVALQVGSSKVEGSGSYEKRGKRPTLALDLNAKTLQLDDFTFEHWASDGKKSTSAKSKRKGPIEKNTVLPSVFSHQVLSRLDLSLKLDVGIVLSGKDRLSKGNLVAELKDSRLKIEPLKLGVPGGFLNGNLLFHPKSNGQVDWKVHLEAKDFELGVLARRAKPESKLSALANVDADLSASNVPFGRPQLKEASGKLDLTVCPRNLDADALDIWATNLIFAVLPNLGLTNKSKINCLIAHLSLENGVILPEMLALDTTRLRVGGEGKIDLVRDEYDLILTPYPKSPQLFSMELPIGVKGSLNHPKVETGSFTAVRAAGRIAANTVLFPVKFIVNERLPQDGSDICPCAGESPQPEKPKKESAAPKKEKKKGFFSRLFRK